ncbi:MAG: DUF969 family protein, partial [Sphingomonadaceae bacterium]|nr:DUF969 family protein [Sphingomonadaceae bacterium]
SLPWSGRSNRARPLSSLRQESVAEAAAEKAHGALDEATRDRVRGMAAATDNIGLFFGEDIFVAIASILLIQATFATYGIALTPLELSVWAIPTAILAFLIHGGRLLAFDRALSGSPHSRHSRESGNPAALSVSPGAVRSEEEKKKLDSRLRGNDGGEPNDSPSPNPLPKEEGS